MVILSMTKSTTAVSLSFDIINSVKSGDIVQSGAVKAIKRCHKFIFTMFSSGVVCILFVKYKTKKEVHIHVLARFNVKKPDSYCFLYHKIMPAALGFVVIGC